MGREKIAIKMYRIELETALYKIAKANRLAGSGVTSDKEWKAFDKACFEADFWVFDALCCVAEENLVPESDEKKLISALKELHNIRVEVYINWEMAKREAEAIADPTGKYGVMRARRLESEAAIRGSGNDQANLN